MITTMRWLFPVCALLLLSTARPGAAETVLLDSPITAQMAGWKHQGEARFSVEIHEGLSSACITVPADTPIQYQQYQYDITRDILPGDDFQISAKVRSAGVADGVGAYLALEFLDAAQTRIGLTQSVFSRQAGAAGWELLSADGRAPAHTAVVRMSLILHAHASAWFAEPRIVRTAREEPWPQLGSALRTIRIDPSNVIQPDFGGVGFHAFQHAFPTSQTEMDQVIYKRWNELRPSFTRVNHDRNWDQAMLDRVATHLLRMKATGTEIYVTTWNPPDARTPEEYAAYARQIADHLDYLIRVKGCTNIRYYCCSNELSLTRWGEMIGDMSRFKAFHEALYAEFQKRRLPVGLLATDASPLSAWSTIQWASDNMDSITAAYGGHHYVTEYLPEDERFYPWFLAKLKSGAKIARDRNKPFILGEFGSKQDGRTVDGVLRDVCVYYDTPQEPEVGIQLSEAVIAATNAGIHAMGYWTFMDLPDDFAKGYINKWGLFKDSGADRSTRAPYYAYGLLTRAFRGPAAVVVASSDDPRLRIAAIRNTVTGIWSIAIVNRNTTPVPASIRLGVALSDRFRKTVYDPLHVPSNRFGDLQPPAAILAMKRGVLTDTLPAGALVVYTNDLSASPPGPLGALHVTHVADGSVHLTWSEASRTPAAYYRIYGGEVRNTRGGKRTEIGTTIALDFTTSASDGAFPYYAVHAVSASGDEGPATWIQRP